MSLASRLPTNSQRWNEEEIFSYSPRLGWVLPNLQTLVLKAFYVHMWVLLQVVGFTLCCLINDRLNSPFMRISAIFTVPPPVHLPLHLSASVHLNRSSLCST
jgi:hypothetical protein